MQPSPAFMRGLVLALSLFHVHASAFAQQAPPSETGDARAPSSLEAGLETDASSRYVFRGLVYSEGPVTQSTAWLSLGGLSLYAWSNVALPAPAGARRLDEVDLGASYSFGQGDLTVEPALDIYLYRPPERESGDGADPHTAELSVRVSYTIDGATLFTRQIVDAASYRGAYFGELGATYERALSPGWDVAASVRMGWASARFNREYLGVVKPAVGLIEARVSLTRMLGRHFYVKPHLEITTVPDGELRASIVHPTVRRVGLAFGVVR